jgi:hypothetical protein
MSTTPVLKNKKTSAVEVSDDSRTAQRKRAKPQAPAETPAAPAKRAAKTTTAKPRRESPAQAVPMPAPTEASPSPAKPARTKRVRAQATAAAAPVAKPKSTPAKKKRVPSPPTPLIQESPVAADASTEPIVAAPSVVVRAPIPEPELWEKDSPVMRRISQLRTRNAQLSAQVLRLKKPL